MRIEEISKAALKEADDKELLRLRWVCNTQWKKHFQPNPEVQVVGCFTRPQFIAKYQILLNEIGSRSLADSTNDLDRQAFAKAMETAKTGFNLDELEAIPVDDCAIIVTKESFDADKLHIIVLAEESEAVDLCKEAIEDAATKECQFEHKQEFKGECIPLFRQKMVPVLSLEKATIEVEDCDEAEGLSKFACRFLPVAKADEDERIVYGIVYEPDVVDSQGDKATAKTIRKAAYQFMEHVQNFKVNHAGASVGVRVLENYLAPSSFTMSGQKVKKGTWVLATRVLDETLWESVKKGELTGYSMAGRATTD